MAGREPGGVALWCDKRVVVLPPLVIDGEEVQELTLLVDNASATPDRAHAILRETLPLKQELWPLLLPALPHLIADPLDHLHVPGREEEESVEDLVLDCRAQQRKRRRVCVLGRRAQRAVQTYAEETDTPRELLVL